MRIKVRIDGSLTETMRAEMAAGERAVSGAIASATNGTKAQLRGMTVAAGLGSRLAKAWRGEVYPKGQPSLSAAGMVWSKAPKIIRAYTTGALIRSEAGFYLAIPTDAAPKRGIGGKKINPTNFPEHRYGRLRFVYRGGGRPSLLVVDSVRISGRTGRATRQAKGGALTKRGAYRKGVASVVMFILVPQVRIRKRIDFEGTVNAWGARLPAMILARWEQEARDGDRR